MCEQYLSKSPSPGLRVKKLFVTALSALVLTTASVSAQTDIITLGDGSKYEIYLESHVGNTWTYFVREDSGKSLSHWNVGIPSCIGHITAHTPTQGYDTTDGSTGFKGIKWNVAESFTSGTFSVTLDADYPETMVKAQAKAGEKGNERTGDVKGPDCSGNDTTSSPNTPTPTENGTASPSTSPNNVSEVCKVMYGVQDYGLNNTQFVTIDFETLGVIGPLGPQHPGHDIERLDLSPSEELYG